MKKSRQNGCVRNCSECHYVHRFPLGFFDVANLPSDFPTMGETQNIRYGKSQDGYQFLGSFTFNILFERSANNFIYFLRQTEIIYEAPEKTTKLYMDLVKSQAETMVKIQ